MKKIFLFLLFIQITVSGQRPDNEITHLFNPINIDLTERMSNAKYFPPFMYESPFLTSDFSFPEPANLTNAITLWATWYHTPQMTAIASGTPLRDINGNILGPHLSLYDWCHAAMQGSVRVLHLNGDAKTYSFAGKTSAYNPDCTQWYSRTQFTIEQNKFRLATGPYGDGARYYVLPYRSIAVDPDTIPYGTVIYVPEARGVLVDLPDGRRVPHDGYFFAADTGSAIHDNHIDVFMGVANSCPFDFVTSNSSRTFTAYKISDADIIAAMKYAHQNIASIKTGTLVVLKPLQNETVDNPVLFKSQVTGDVKKVKYFAENDFLLGESANAENDFEITYSFAGINRVRALTIKGYDSEGMLINNTTKSLQITPVEAGEGTVSITEPVNNSTISSPFDIKTSITGDVKIVKYYVNDVFAGQSNNENNNFALIGINSNNRNIKIEAKGYSNTDIYINDATTFITATIENCQNQCVENEQRCNGLNVEKCVKIDSCLNWVVETQCNPEQYCEDYLCKEYETCEDECVMNQKICSNNSVYICGNNDSDICSEKIYMKTCNENQLCKSGVCIRNNSTCDKCVEGQRRCYNNNVEICKLDLRTNCLSYAVDKECPVTDICLNYNCSSKYTEEGKCIPGVRYCSDIETIYVCKSDGSNYEFNSVCDDNSYCEGGYCRTKTTIAQNDDGSCNFAVSPFKFIHLMFILLSVIIIRRRLK